jgi:L-threonylcarbamoyladenylate synthase
MELLALETGPMKESALRRAAAVVRRGGVIVFPTDTFYGLGCDPFNPDAVRRVYEIKERDRDKPLLLIIADAEQLQRLTTDPPNDLPAIISRFWPGPLTLVLRAAPALPPPLTAQTGTIGLRLPAYEPARQLASYAGGAITATSANLSGGANPSSAEAVRAELGEHVDLILDAGHLTAGAPSTVLDLTQQPPRLLREGAISREALDRVTGRMKGGAGEQESGRKW